MMWIPLDKTCTNPVSETHTVNSLQIATDETWNKWN